MAKQTLTQIKQEIYEERPAGTNRPPDDASDLYHALKNSDDRLAVAIREIAANALTYNGNLLIASTVLIGARRYLLIMVNSDPFPNYRDVVDKAHWGRSGEDDDDSTATHGGGGKSVGAGISPGPAFEAHIGSKTPEDGFVSVCNKFHSKTLRRGGKSDIVGSDVLKPERLKTIIGAKLYNHLTNFWLYPCGEDIKLTSHTVQTVSLMLGDEILNAMDVRLVIGTPERIMGGGSTVDGGEWKIEDVVNVKSLRANPMIVNDLYDDATITWTACPRVEPQSSRTGRLPLLAELKPISFRASIDVGYEEDGKFEVIFKPRLHAKCLDQYKNKSKADGSRPDRVLTLTHGGSPTGLKARYNMHVFSQTNIRIAGSSRDINPRLRKQTVLRNDDAMGLLRALTGLTITKDNLGAIDSKEGKEAILNRWVEFNHLTGLPVESVADNLVEVRPVVVHDIYIKPLNFFAEAKLGKHTMFFLYDKDLIRKIFRAIDEELNAHPEYVEFVDLIDNLFCPPSDDYMPIRLDNTGHPSGSRKKVIPLYAVHEDDVTVRTRKVKINGEDGLNYTMATTRKGIVCKLRYQNDDVDGKWKAGEEFKGTVKSVTLTPGWSVSTDQDDEIGTFYTIRRTIGNTKDPDTGKDLWDDDHEMAVTGAYKELRFYDPKSGMYHKLVNVFNDPYMVFKSGPPGRGKMQANYEQMGDPNLFGHRKPRKGFVLNTDHPMISKMFRGTEVSKNFEFMTRVFRDMVEMYDAADVEYEQYLDGVSSRGDYKYPDTNTKDLAVNRLALSFYMDKVWKEFAKKMK